MIDNEQQHRFEAQENGLTVFANYREHDGHFILTHVEADPALRGTGAAPRLMEAIVGYARAHDLKLVPRCTYAVAWFRRHPDAQDVVG
jgi:predicted GNAT family acetyltransferase